MSQPPRHPFESDDPKNSLPPPFNRPGQHSKREREGEQFPFEPFSVGGADVGPIPLAGVGEEGGMLVGPEHPGFWQRRPDPNRMHPAQPHSFLPPGAVPPGARFDPITPLSPGSSTQGIPSGEPDPDAEEPKGPRTDPLNPGWKPPRGPPGPFQGFDGSGAPFFR